MLVRNSREIGDLVRDARTRLGLTQAALADRVGVSRKWIIDLEGGKRAADLSLVLQTLNALGLELDVRDRGRKRTRRAGADINAIVDEARRRRA